jgi:hypothetical protein
MTTYGVMITFGTQSYSFHVSTVDKVRELFQGLTESVDSFDVQAEYAGTIRPLSHREVREIIEGQYAAA